MKFRYLLLLFLSISCNEPTNVNQPSGSYYLNGTVISGYHKITRGAKTVDSIQLTNIDSMYKILGLWNKILVKSDTMFFLSDTNENKRYVGLKYVQCSDSMSFTGLGVFDGNFALKYGFNDSQELKVKGNNKKYYTEYSKAEIYIQDSLVVFFGMFPINTMKEKYFNSDSSFTDCFQVIYQQ
jgi:hypothetical protein